MGDGGGAGGTRTPDFLRAKEALSQLSYSPTQILLYAGFQECKRAVPLEWDGPYLLNS